MQNMAEYAIVAFKRGQGETIFNYSGKQRYIQGSYLRGMNVIDNYVKPAEKMKFQNKILRVEEKSADLYMEIYSRFANPGCTIFDLFAGTATSAFAALKSGMKWYGCEIDKLVFTCAQNRSKNQFEVLYKTNSLPRLNNSPVVPTSSVKEKVKFNFPTSAAVKFLDDCSATSVLLSEYEINGLEVKDSELERERRRVVCSKRFQGGRYSLHILGRDLEREGTHAIGEQQISWKQVCEDSKVVERVIMLMEILLVLQHTSTVLLIWSVENC